MPRPSYPAAKARRLLTVWIELRIPKSPSDAPITTIAALAHLAEHGLPAHRATFYQHQLHELVKTGAARQAEEGGGRRLDAERKMYDEQIDALREQNSQLELRSRTLLGEIATLVWNARRLGVKEEDLREQMPKTDRSRSRAGRKR